MTESDKKEILHRVRMLVEIAKLEAVGQSSTVVFQEEYARLEEHLTLLVSPMALVIDSEVWTEEEMQRLQHMHTSAVANLDAILNSPPGFLEKMTRLRHN